ncbi:MAG TPA: two-component regulator propeller domain-containing protein, partial [candidate division Zixibacteria bacterium]|nr:two-component regulator propeller domain-containing protein [candidate division Zixibacteria bacterium]
DRFGNIWISTYGGLSRYVPESDNFDSHVFSPNNESGLGFPIIQDIFEDSRGDLWIGTAGGGFDKYDPKNETFSHFLFDDEERIDNIGPDNIQTFYEDKAGHFWLGTLAGLGRFDRDSGEIEYYKHDPDDPNSLSNEYVLAVYEDSSGTLWVGTQNGLNRFVAEDGTFVRYDQEDGLPDNAVYGILEDSHGNLWFSSNRGITRFTPSDGSFVSFDTGDGVQALEFNVRSAYQSDDGQMFFGGINGYNHFYPDEITNNPYIPPIVVTEFQIMNQDVEHGEDSRIPKPIIQLDHVKLNRGDTSISFDMASLHFSTPEDNQYAYIMEGFDEEWNYIGNRRHATYTNLPPGEYTFRVAGTNSDGIWNTDGTAINISMAYPYWRTWWFLLLVAILFGAVVFIAVRLRTRSTEARTRELEAQVVSRTSEVEQRREIAEVLREILVILNSSQSLEESLHYIVDQAARLTDAEDAIIFRQEISAKNVAEQITIIATNEGGQIRYSPGIALLTITNEWIDDGLQSKQPLIMPNLEAYWSDHPKIQPAAISLHQALLGVPLHLGDEIYGGLLMFYTEERKFSEDDLELGSTFADQAALAIANDRLRAQAEETAVATERNRLARDLHDAVTQTLFSASLIAETLPLIYESNPSEGQNLLQELRQLTRGALAEMRTLLLELRPIALEESELPDLLLQLSEAVTGRTGVPINTTIERPCPLPVQIRIALYRIAQESLNNVMKHARASVVDVKLSGCVEGDVVSLSVTDNGRGYDTDQVSQDRMGLKIINERAQAIGAELDINSQPGEGTRVEVRWRASALDED